MALSTWNCSSLGLILVLLLSLPFLSSQSVSMGRRMAIGSRPPGCVDKCLSCQPCMATLVISPSQKNNKISKIQDDTYYLLSWKCRCRDHLFQP